MLVSAEITGAGAVDAATASASAVAVGEEVEGEGDTDEGGETVTVEAGDFAGGMSDAEWRAVRGAIDETMAKPRKAGLSE